MAVLFLLAVFSVPIIAMICAMCLAEKESLTVADLRAKRAALLAAATPPIFTFLGVVLYMLKVPLSDKWSLALFWAVMILFVALLIIMATCGVGW
jgi:protein-S-isoprenylcysteine O-methyltransferase Ste14